MRADKSDLATLEGMLMTRLSHSCWLLTYNDNMIYNDNMMRVCVCVCLCMYVCMCVLCVGMCVCICICAVFMCVHLIQRENNRPYNKEQSTGHSFCPHNSSQDVDTPALYPVNESPVTTHPTQFPKQQHQTQ